MIKNIILDMGNVLLTFDPEIPLNHFCSTEEAKNIIRKELFQGPEWIQGDYGFISGKDRYEPVSRRVPEIFHESLRNCVEHWDICMKPVSGAMDFCEYVKVRRYGIYVLSNADDAFHDYFPRFADEEYFDGVMVSSDVHMIKPETRIYEYFLKTYRLIPEECLFIDDREENITGAQKAGINGYLFKGNFEKIKELLEQLDNKETL